jgi:hypothetical protein
MVNKLKAVKRLFQDRLKERSSWAGLLLLITGVALRLRPELTQNIIETASELIGLLYLVTSDKKTSKEKTSSGTKKKPKS